MEVRYITKFDDRKAISRIYEKSWKYTYSGIVPQEYLDSIHEGQWAAKIDTLGWRTMVCVENDEFVGTCSFSKSRFEKYGDVGEIISVYFLPEHMRKGYGSILLRKVLDAFKEKGYKEIFLWVLEENTGARQFYEYFGFACTYDFREDTIGGNNLREVRYIYRFVSYNDYKILDNKLKVFYLQNYVPQNKVPGIKESEYDREIRKKIWDYKKAGDSTSRVMLEMTSILHQGLIQLATEGKLESGEKINEYEKYLIAVPTSNYGRKSSVAKSIDIICEKDKDFLDKCNLLYRSKDITPQHLRNDRYSLKELEESLDCIYDNMDKVKNSVFFLIDDIVTSGSSMLSCVRTLEKHGISRYKIFCLALARTRSQYDQF